MPEYDTGLVLEVTVPSGCNALQARQSPIQSRPCGATSIVDRDCLPAAFADCGDILFFAGNKFNIEHGLPYIFYRFLLLSYNITKYLLPPNGIP